MITGSCTGMLSVLLRASVCSGSCGASCCGGGPFSSGPKYFSASVLTVASSVSPTTISVALLGR